MLSLDLFDSRYERDLREGAVDNLEARRIDDLNMRMLELLDRAKEPAYKKNPDALAGLKRQFQKIKAERDSYFKINPATGMNADQTLGTTKGRLDDGQVTPTATGLRHHAKPENYGGYEPEADPLARLDKHAVNRADKAIGVKFDREKKYQGGLDVDEGGIPGNVPTEKIPGKEDLLKGKGRSYYEDQKKNSDEVDEHGGGIGPRQHWQDLMQEGQPLELMSRYLAIDSDNDVDAVKQAIQTISKDPNVSEASKARLLGQLGMIIKRYRLPIGRDYYQFMQQYMEEQSVTETVVDVKSGMADIYRRLAPKIERNRDSFLAGQLYDELENYAELHGAEREFKQMMNSARNRAHMEYDTNPGGFHNWFWFLPFEDESLDEIDRRGFLKGLGATAGLAAMSGVKAATSPDDPSWRKVGQPFDNSVTTSDQVKQVSGQQPTLSSRIANVKGPNAKGEYLVTVIHDDNIVSDYVTKNPPKSWMQGTHKAYPQVEGMAESTDDIKKRMSKLEALALAANRAGDDAKCKMYQQKIQTLKQKLSQSMNELDASGYDRYSIYMDDYDLEEKFSDLDDAIEAIEEYKRDDPKSRYEDYNVRDLNGKVVWRNDAWQDVPKPGKIQFLPRRGQGMAEATGDSKFDNMMGKISKDPWTQLNSDPNWEYEIEELVDQHIEPWLLAMERSGMPITRDNETLNPGWRKRYEQISTQLAQKYLASKKFNPRDPDLVGKIRAAIDNHTDQSRNVHGQLSAYADDLPLQRYADAFDADGMTANIRDAMAGLAPRDDDEDDGYASRPTANPRRLDPGNMEEGWSDAMVARRTGTPRTPYSVFIKGRKWKDFENDDHAEAVANKLRAKFKAEGRDPGVITVAPTDISKGVTEDQDTSGVEQAILKRIMVAHLDLLRQYGPDKVMQAAEEVAYNVGDVDEIGTSDVSAYVAQVKQILGATP